MSANLPRPSSTENVSFTLNTGISDVASSMDVSDASNIVSPCYLVIDRVDSAGTLKNTSFWEYVKVTNVSSNTLTISRGQNGSTAQSHSAGAVIEAVVTSAMFEDWYNALNTDHAVSGGHVIATATIAYGEVQSLAVTSIASISTLNIGNLVLPNIAVTSIASISQGNVSSFYASNETITAVSNIKTLAFTSIASAAVSEFTTQNVNGHVFVKPGVSKLLLTQGLRQDNTTNTYESPYAEEYGWGFITGDASNTRIPKTVTFGQVFSAPPVVVTSFSGLLVGSDPTLSSGFVTTTDDQIDTRTYNTTASNVVVELKSNTGLTSGTRYGYSWIAKGKI